MAFDANTIENAIHWAAAEVVQNYGRPRQLVALLNRIRRAELPGGVAVDLDQEIKEVKALSAKVQEEPTPPDRKRGPTIPLTEANARLIQLDLRPSLSGLDMSYYRNLAEQDPNVALAGSLLPVRNVVSGDVLRHVLYGGC